MFDKGWVNSFPPQEYITYFEVKSGVNYEVYADENAKYYIGSHNRSCYIQTNTHYKVIVTTCQYITTKKGKIQCQDIQSGQQLKEKKR